MIERFLYNLLWNYNCVFNSRATKILLSFIARINYIYMYTYTCNRTVIRNFSFNNYKLFLSCTPPPGQSTCTCASHSVPPLWGVCWYAVFCCDNCYAEEYMYQNNTVFLNTFGMHKRLKHILSDIAHLFAMNASYEADWLLALGECHKRKADRSAY